MSTKVNDYILKAAGGKNSLVRGARWFFAEMAQD
jgi:hypothetical protein